MKRNFTHANPFPFEKPHRAFAEQGGGDAGGAEGGAEGAAPEQPGGFNAGLYDLSDAPEELKPWLQRELQRMESGVGTRVQKASELEKKFGAFSDIEGLSDVPAEELQELLGLREVFSSPETVSQWLGQIAEESDYAFLDEDSWVKAGEAKGWLEGGDPDEEGAPAAQSSPEVEALRAELEELKGWKQEFTGKQEQEQTVAQAEAQLSSRMEELTSKVQGWDEAASEEDPQPDTNAVIELAHAYLDDEDPIGKAFDRYMKISGKADAGLLDTKLNGPGGTLSGGQADTSPEQYGHDDSRLKDAARARFAQSR